MKPAPEVAYVQVEGEMVLMDPGAERYYALDDVGARFWELFVEHEEVDAVIPELLDEYDVEESRLRADVDALVQQLVQAGLVVGTA